MGSDIVPHVPFDIDIPGDGRRVDVSVTPAAAAHLTAWDTSAKLKAAHESAHVICATALGVRVVAVDIKGRSSGMTEVGIDQDDQADYETASAQFNRIVVALAGRSIDSLLLGEPSTGSLSDIDDATGLSLTRFDAGLDPESQLISIQRFYGAEPESLKELRANAAIATMNRAQSRAAELVVEYQSQILEFARRLYLERRLADEALLAAIREVGLEPVPLAE